MYMLYSMTEVSREAHMTQSGVTLPEGEGFVAPFSLVTGGTQFVTGDGRVFRSGWPTRDARRSERAAFQEFKDMVRTQIERTTVVDMPHALGNLNRVLLIEDTVAIDFIEQHPQGITFWSSNPDDYRDIARDQVEGHFGPDSANYLAILVENLANPDSH